MLGRFYFEQISKSVLRLLKTARTIIRIGIAVQYQYACIVKGQGLNSRDNDNNQVYFKIIDNLYIIVQDNIS